MAFLEKKGNIDYCTRPLVPARETPRVLPHNQFLLILMDTQSATYLCHRLERYARAVAETKAHFSEITPLGKYPASAPYFERCGIRELFDALDDDSARKETLMQTFQAIGHELMTLEREQGSAYRHLLHAELTARLDVYAAAVCHANLGCRQALSGPDLVSRDRIIVLIRELATTHDVTGAKDLLQAMDACFLPTGTESTQDLFSSTPQDRAGMPHANRSDGIEG